MKALFCLCLLISAVLSAPSQDDFAAFSMDSRIINGKEPQPAQLPYMVKLYVRFWHPDGYEYGGECGGSLISDQFILTAAHCTVDAVRVKVYLGAHDVSKDQEEGRMEFTVEKDNIISYNYDHPTRKDDIALLRLPEKVPLTREIRPLILPRRSQTNLIGEGVIISGWGTIENRQGTEILRYGQVRILEDDVCKNFYSDYYYHPTNICIQGQGQSACHGDSGGPAVMIDREERTFVQVGVVSYGSPHGCEKGHPTSFARVTSFLDWIHEHTGIPIRD